MIHQSESLGGLGKLREVRESQTRLLQRADDVSQAANQSADILS